MAEKAVTRGSQLLWTPPETDIAVSVTQALGCADLKSPVPVLSASFMSEVVELDANSCHGLVLLADGARQLSDKHVSERMQRYCGRPRAAALRLALDAADAAPAATNGSAQSSGEAV